MPYAVPDGGIVSLTFEGRVLNQQVMNVFHYRLDQPGGITDGGLALDGLVTNVNAAAGLHAKYMACMSTNYRFGRIRAQWILPTRHAYHQIVPTIVQGQVESPVIAPNTAVVMNKRSEDAGPHSRGVTHLPGVPMDAVDAGTVSVFGFGIYNSFKDKFLEGITSLATGDMLPVLYNRVTPGNSETITTAIIDENLRTMHRRTVGLGS